MQQLQRCHYQKQLRRRNKMEISRGVLKQAGLLPKLQLGIKSGRGVTSTGKHTVKMISDKIIKKPAMEEGDDVHWVRYIVEEDGVQKQYDTRMKQKGGVDPSYFVQAMAAIEPGEEITLEMKKAGIKNYIEIVRTSVGETEMVEDDEEGRDITIE
jgi:hypothetical protein